MAVQAAASLMDDSEFLAELEQMEGGITLQAAPYARPTIEDSMPVERWSIEGLEAPPEPSGLNVRDKAVAAIGFVFLVAVGAAGAAFVFHARLAVLIK